MKKYFAMAVSILILLSADAQGQWAQTNGARGSTIRGFAVNGAGIFAGFTSRYDSAGVIQSTDGGLTWSNVSTGLPLREVDAVFAHGTNLFAAENDAGIYRSTNNGASWTTTGMSTSYIEHFASIGTNLFAADDNNGVCLSTDNGASWTFKNSGLTNTSLRSLFANGSNLYAGTRGGGVFLSTNNGASWTAVNSGLTQLYIYAFAQIGSNLFAGTWSKGVFLSTNNGASWTAVNTGLPTTYPFYAFAVSGTNLFAGTAGGGVYLSTNNGSSWTAVNTGLSNLSVLTLAINGSYLFAGGELTGIWRRPLSEMVTEVNAEQERISTRFVLDQNYPNPFNPSTTISFSLPSQSFVTLKVFDMIGREIATLASGEMNAGVHGISWNAADCASGMYFYRLQAGSFTQTKKLLLIR